MIRGLMTDEEWALFEPHLVRRSALGWRPPHNHRRVLDGILWICRTGTHWRDLPGAFGDWNAVSRQFRRWCASGVWDKMLQTLADSGGDADLLQMIDSTTIRAHRCAAGQKGGLKTRRLAGRAGDCSGLLVEVRTERGIGVLQLIDAQN